MLAGLGWLGWQSEKDILIYDWVPISREITLLWLIDNYKKPAGK